MDLSFALSDRQREVTLLPSDLAVLMVGVAARQAASPTARAQVLAGPAVQPTSDGTDPRLLEPQSGAFNGGVATSLAEWAEP